MGEYMREREILMVGVIIPASYSYDYTFHMHITDEFFI